MILLLLSFGLMLSFLFKTSVITLNISYMQIFHGKKEKQEVKNFVNSVHADFQDQIFTMTSDAVYFMVFHCYAVAVALAYFIRIKYFYLITKNLKKEII